MKKFLLLAALAAGLSGCAGGYRQNDPALVGGLLGAGAGAIVGGAVTGRPGGVLAGAVIGGAGGALVGDAMGRRERRDNRRYRGRNCVNEDAYGRRYRVAC